MISAANNNILFRIVFNFICLLLMYCPYGLAQPQIKVVLLGDNFAMIEIDDTRHTIRVGDPAVDGVTLLSANSQQATVAYEGKKMQLGLGTAMGMNTEEPAVNSAEAETLKVSRDKAGMYRIPGKINDKDVRFLLDTGASTVVMSGETAKNLGINYEKGKVHEVSTASAHSQGYAVTLDHINVGSIVLNNVPALVMAGKSPEEVLLGMSAISNLHIENSGEELHIQKK